MSIHGLLTCHAKTITSLQITMFTTKHLESITTNLVHLDNRLHITNVYMIPRAHTEELFDLIENVISTLPHNEKVIITRDFNIDILKPTNSQRVLLEFMHSHRFYLTNDKSRT